MEITLNEKDREYIAEQCAAELAMRINPPDDEEN